jgi:NAD(P)-dependent dehydrogenase (short-subunit alcohol dehydrogenase family)
MADVTDYQKLTYLFTGGGHGIGYELTKQSLANGDYVIPTYRSQEGKEVLEALQAEHPEYSPRFVIGHMELGDQGSIRNFLTDLSVRLSADNRKIDVLVNNAAASSIRDIELNGTDEARKEDRARLMRINCDGTMFITRGLLDMTPDGPQGKLINPQRVFIANILSSVVAVRYFWWAEQLGIQGYAHSKQMLYRDMRKLAGEAFEAHRANASPVVCITNYSPGSGGGVEYNSAVKTRMTGFRGQQTPQKCAELLLDLIKAGLQNFGATNGTFLGMGNGNGGINMPDTPSPLSFRIDAERTPAAS